MEYYIFNLLGGEFGLEWNQSVRTATNIVQVKLWLIHSLIVHTQVYTVHISGATKCLR